MNAFTAPQRLLYHQVVFLTRDSISALCACPSCVWNSLIVERPDLSPEQKLRRPGRRSFFVISDCLMSVKIGWQGMMMCNGLLAKQSLHAFDSSSGDTWRWMMYGRCERPQIDVRMAESVHFVFNRPRE